MLKPVTVRIALRSALQKPRPAECFDVRVPCPGHAKTGYILRRTEQWLGKHRLCQRLPKRRPIATDGAKQALQRMSDQHEECGAVSSGTRIAPKASGSLDEGSQEIEPRKGPKRVRGGHTHLDGPAATRHVEHSIARRLLTRPSPSKIGFALNRSERARGARHLPGQPLSGARFLVPTKGTPLFVFFLL